MTPETLVLFDIDGTLLRAGGSGRVASERAMIEVFGRTGKLAEYNFMGKTDFFTLVHLLTPEGLSEAEIEAALPHFSAAMGRHMAEIVGQYTVQALPGTLELIQALKAQPNALVGIITGNMRESAAIKLQAAGFSLEDFAVGVYGSEARIRRDLMPIILNRAEEHCGVKFVAPNVVVIGDTPDDIDCAHCIGARAIAVATGWVLRAELEKHAPVTVLNDLSDTAAVMSLLLTY
jgi:phosphoglycolate phosphatase